MYNYQTLRLVYAFYELYLAQEDLVVFLDVLDPDHCHYVDFKAGRGKKERIKKKKNYLSFQATSPNTTRLASDAIQPARGMKLKIGIRASHPG